MDEYACEIGRYDSERSVCHRQQENPRKLPDLGIRATPKHNEKFATLCFE